MLTSTHQRLRIIHCYWINNLSIGMLNTPGGIDYFKRRKIRLIENNAKSRHLKKLTCKWTSRQVFICLMPPPLIGFCLGWCGNFVGSESGQIQSVKLLQNMVSNRTQHPIPSQPHTVCTYSSVLWHREGGGRWTREKVIWAIVYKAGSKIPTWLTVSPVYELY